MEFSPTITIGTVIEVLTFVIGGISLVSAMKGRIDLMGKEINAMKVEVAKLAEILTKLAVQDARLQMVEKTVDEMRHGIGFIVQRPE